MDSANLILRYQRPGRRPRTCRVASLHWRDAAYQPETPGILSLPCPVAQSNNYLPPGVGAEMADNKRIPVVSLGGEAVFLPSDFGGEDIKIKTETTDAQIGNIVETVERLVLAVRGRKFLFSRVPVTTYTAPVALAKRAAVLDGQPDKPAGKVEI